MLTSVTFNSAVFSSTMLIMLTANLLITWFVFTLSTSLYNTCRQFPLFHPLILSAITLILLLTVFDISIQAYQQNSEVLMMMLAPATVALGVPLYKNLQILSQYKNVICLPLLLGALISPCSALFLLWLFDVDHTLLLSMVSKSITSPIAIDITNIIGGIPALAVIFVIISGIIGAAIATPLFSFLSIEHPISKGLALGVASHAIGTSAALQISDQCAAFSVLAMCLNGVFTTIIIVVYTIV